MFLRNAVKSPQKYAGDQAKKHERDCASDEAVQQDKVQAAHESKTNTTSNWLLSSVPEALSVEVTPQKGDSSISVPYSGRSATGHTKSTPQNYKQEIAPARRKLSFQHFSPQPITDDTSTFQRTQFDEKKRSPFYSKSDVNATKTLHWLEEKHAPCPKNVQQLTMYLDKHTALYFEDSDSDSDSEPIEFDRKSRPPTSMPKECYDGPVPGTSKSDVYEQVVPTVESVVSQQAEQPPQHAQAADAEQELTAPKETSVDTKAVADPSQLQPEKRQRLSMSGPAPCTRERSTRMAAIRATEFIQEMSVALLDSRGLPRKKRTYSTSVRRRTSSTGHAAAAPSDAPIDYSAKKRKVSQPDSVDCGTPSAVAGPSHSRDESPKLTARRKRPISSQDTQSSAPSRKRARPSVAKGPKKEDLPTAVGGTKAVQAAPTQRALPSVDTTSGKARPRSAKRLRPSKTVPAAAAGERAPGPKAGSSSQNAVRPPRVPNQGIAKNMVDNKCLPPKKRRRD